MGKLPAGRSRPVSSSGYSRTQSPHRNDGRLVKPFALTIPLGFAYYVVCPETTAERPKVAAFREWIMEEAGTPAFSAVQ